MPHVQRSLSVEDLRQRYQPREQDGSQGQDSYEPPPPPLPRDPPPLPRDFEAIRAHGQRFKREQDSSHSQNSPESPPPSLPLPLRSPPFQRPFLSPRFPDPPIFNSSGTGILFEDWKLRIQDKLLINKDHYPSEHSQIAYIITRLGGKAIEHTLRKRRTNSYYSVDQLLSQLSDIYELTMEVIDDVNRTAFNTLEQGDRPFPEFCSDFMKYSQGDDEQHTMFSLRTKVNYGLRKQLAMSQKRSSLPELREQLMIVDHLLRAKAARKAERLERKAKENAERFNKQLVMARIEAQSKRPGKYAIMPPSDPEEFRRW